jgi:LysM domain
MLEILALTLALQQQSSVHTVVPGDTLSAIAGPDWPAVCAANGIANCNLIYVGEQITLGGASSTPPGTSPTTETSPGSPSAPGALSGSAAGASPGTASSTGSGSSLSDVPGVPSSFAACVAFRESTDGELSGNVYGIMPQSGYDGYGASLAQQKQDFAALYAADGTAPWAPSDGC